MSKRFLYSDPHFGHKNIIDYESRPFADVEVMTEGLIERWNKTVGKFDHVFVLGDFSFLGRDKTKEIVARLNGYKHLILGNHDRHRTVTWWREVGFNEVSQYPIMVDGFYILSHEPIYLNKHMPYVNIHGHTHGVSQDSPQYVNVSVEVIDYKPILFDRIQERFKGQDEQE